MSPRALNRCAGCGGPLRVVSGLYTCDTAGCPGNLVRTYKPTLGPHPDRRARRRREVYAVRTLGWQLDYRRGRWLPLGVREGTVRPRWLVLPLGRYGWVTLGRVVKPR